jgi:hypothetical protein
MQTNNAVAMAGRKAFEAFRAQIETEDRYHFNAE